MDTPTASVLVVEDDPVNRMVVTKLAEREGHQVTAAEHGKEACRILETSPVDIVLTDIDMPEMDGYGLLERIQGDARLRDIPVIMISANEDIDSVVRAIEMGADDYLPKPPNRTLLRARINASLERKRLRDGERQRVRNLFARFVPETVVDQVIGNVDDNLRLGGERCEATVMFSDLRGFTTWAEASSPDQVIDVLNRYMSTMSDVVLDHGGTLVTYMGDGIMAVFGAPIEHEHHADLAVAAARAMVLEALPDFNAWLRGRDLGDGFRMGVGLNSGPVMSGNVGTDRRVEYTVVGDTANTASRVEQMTKESPYSVLLADATLTRMSRAPEDLVPVGEFTPRGRQAAIQVWGMAAGAG